MVVEASETAPSLPYHEPDIVTILVQTSLLLLLNVVNAVLDRVLYCGLLGQVFLGITWGTPGAKWLSTHTEEVIVQLGYLGLILLVYEGGLSTSFQSLKANLLLSSGVAITGIALPIALSYSLQGLLGATPLQAFAAGAALCSTSLGTTFTVLGSSGLSSSRLGVVLTSAAMMDDVVGLVMVQVISNLGEGNISAVTVVRPVFVSIAFAVVVPLVCHFLIKPLTLSLNRYREAHTEAQINRLLCRSHTVFAIHTALLVALVTGASYAGTSNLFAAYIGGATISWWDSEVPHVANPTDATQGPPAEEKANQTRTRPQARDPGERSISGEQIQCTRAATAPSPGNIDIEEKTAPERQIGKHSSKREASLEQEELSGPAIYERYYQQAVSRILQPFFFASIGFSIPITRMFRGSIVWRGIVFTVLMTFAKIACGLWLVRFSLTPMKDALRGVLSKVKLPSVPHFWGKSASTPKNRPSDRTHSNGVSAYTETTSAVADTRIPLRTSDSPPKPFSLHPPFIMALAMTARGEIGFLISSVAESNGVFSSHDATPGSESDIFLVVTWAIVLCTIIGPLGVGLSVRRVKKLEERKNREQEGAGRDVLGVWGVE